MMSQPGTTWKLTAGLLVLAGLLTLGVGRPVAAKPPVSLRDGAWTWGYVIPGKLPAAVPFVFPGGRAAVWRPPPRTWARRTSY